MMINLIAYAWTWLHVPYKWGGETIDGVDCSGLVQNILATAGEDPAGDQTAQGLYYHFRKEGNILRKPQGGALVFYGTSEHRITHVAFAVDNVRVLEAGGGGRDVQTRTEAMRSKAWVRVRPWAKRGDVIAVIMPEYKYLKEDDNV